VSAPARLTAGWRRGGPASLPEHLDVYGPLPRRRGRPGLLADAVAEAGLTGRGGAGFPTGTKLRAVAAGRGPAVVVANGMESEPASAKDHSLLARSPHLVLDGAMLAAEAVGADVVHLCLPRTKPDLCDQVRGAVTERQRSGLGGTAIGRSGRPRGPGCSSPCPGARAAWPRPPGCSGTWPTRAPASAARAPSGSPRSPRTSLSWLRAGLPGRCSTGWTAGSA
jgi:hypothetical protein